MVSQSEDALPADFFRKPTSGEFGLAEAIELGRALGELPDRLTVYGIQTATLAPTDVLSEEVAKAADELAARIRTEV